MQTSQYDYTLPQGLIAQKPSEQRDKSRMMVLNRNNKNIEHKQFFNIVDYLSKDDVLVMNSTKVIPARLIGHKSTGAKIEVFLLENLEGNKWEVLIKPSKRVKPETVVEFDEGLSAKVIEKKDNWIVEFDFDGEFSSILEKIGNIPLPPYIQRNLSDEDFKKLDFERYQTVYADKPGSVAAPTAGLHFTDDIIEKLKNKGVQICDVSLNVGLGTFLPVKVDNLKDHKMHREYYEISKNTADIINNAKNNGKNIVAVGTTTVRTLETCYQKFGEIKEVKDWSQIFIYPGFEFKVIDKMITNFHLPKSTLLMLISAFADKDYILKAYEEAIDKKYRFYSYGDCMFLK